MCWAELAFLWSEAFEPVTLVFLHFITFSSLSVSFRSFFHRNLIHLIGYYSWKHYYFSHIDPAILTLALVPINWLQIIFKIFYVYHTGWIRLVLLLFCQLLQFNSLFLQRKVLKWPESPKQCRLNVMVIIPSYS